MTAITRASAKQYFETGDYPTQSQFADTLDSVIFQIGTSAQVITSDVSAAGKFDLSGNLNVLASANTALSGNLVVSGAVTMQNFAAAGTAWTPGYSGFSVVPTGAVASYQKMGKLIVVSYRDTANGTSNAVTYTITGLPFAAVTQTPPLNVIVTDNSVQAAGTVQVAGTTATMTKGAATGGGGFTASGNKACSGFIITYETTT